MEGGGAEDCYLGGLGGERSMSGGDSVVDGVCCGMIFDSAVSSVVDELSDCFVFSIDLTDIGQGGVARCVC